MRHVAWLLPVVGFSAPPAWSQQAPDHERAAARFEDRKGDFDYLLGSSSLWRIRYYDIRPDGFSWTADVSTDDGATWQREYLRIQARRIEPARSLEALARPRLEP
jgi:hypothetical protein